MYDNITTVMGPGGGVGGEDDTENSDVEERDAENLNGDGSVSEITDDDNVKDDSDNLDEKGEEMDLG